MLPPAVWPEKRAYMGVNHLDRLVLGGIVRHRLGQQAVFWLDVPVHDAQAVQVRNCVSNLQAAAAGQLVIRQVAPGGSSYADRSLTEDLS